MGIIRYEVEPEQSIGVLSCPYVWIWLIARASKDDNILANWVFDVYQNYHHSDRIPLSAQSWQNFERFASDFRVLKSNIFADQQSVSINKIHSGVQFTDHVTLIPKHLELICSSKRVDTKYGFVKEVKHVYGTIDVTKGCHLVLNGTGAPAGDYFCCIQEYPSYNWINEIFQTKLLSAKSKISLEDYMQEYNKAAGPADIFLLITTGNCDINSLQLPSPRCGIVHKENWKKYFGPFADRAFSYAALEPPDLNSAPRFWLSGIDGIGSKYADRIIKKRPYSSLEDCHDKTEIPLKILKRCRLIS
ncbi:15972_t:CDS:1 [Funneliformis geosporum]|uniref:9133_t:CDS:1 n=1 Tax=Funneliformis geosporum TaxID=1117311 RepID=A0A9W4WWM7_9GLOM|nr:15972_t:CDS:1 [Funneliformis geosporum]CAI2169097.1 9133_t:CDS:1 [Funneliformis geosporum]